MVGFPNKPTGFPTKNDHFGALWGGDWGIVPPLKETPIFRWWFRSDPWGNDPTLRILSPFPRMLLRDPIPSGPDISG